MSRVVGVAWNSRNGIMIIRPMCWHSWKQPITPAGNYVFVEVRNFL
jgi:hypothetical protein